MALVKMAGVGAGGREGCSGDRAVCGLWTVPELTVVHVVLVTAVPVEVLVAFPVVLVLRGCRQDWWALGLLVGGTGGIWWREAMGGQSMVSVGASGVTDEANVGGVAGDGLGRVGGGGAVAVVAGGTGFCCPCGSAEGVVTLTGGPHLDPVVLMRLADDVLGPDAEAVISRLSEDVGQVVSRAGH